MSIANPPHVKPARSRASIAVAATIRWLALIFAVGTMALIFRYCTSARPGDILLTSEQPGSVTARARIPADTANDLSNDLPDNLPNYEKLNTLLAGQSLLSTIVVPLSIDLSYLQTKINEDLPTRLADVDETKVCIKAAWLKTKVPYLDGIKIKSRQLKTKISPEIRCNIRGHIDRRGPLSITGNGASLQLSLPVHARVTAKAGIRETAVADATFIADTAISIGEDWQPRAVVDTDFRWDRRPELMLFNLVKITFGSKVEPALRKKLQKFEKKIPQLLAGTSFKSDAESLWNDIQQPQTISSHPTVYSHFRPHYAGYTGFTADGEALTTQLIIEGQSRVTTQSPGHTEPVPLPPLVHADKTPGQFHLTVPVIVEEQKVQRVVNKALEEAAEITIEKPGLHGRLTIQQMAINFTDAGKLLIKASVTYDNRKAWLRTIDFFDWFNFSGDVALQIEPELDSNNNVISAGAMQFASQTDSPVADTLIDIFNLPAVRGRLASIIRYDFSADIAKGIKAANDGLNAADNSELSLLGDVSEISVDRLFIVDGALAVVAQAKGQLQATLGSHR